MSPVTARQQAAGGPTGVPRSGSTGVLRSGSTGMLRSGSTGMLRTAPAGSDPAVLAGAVVGELLAGAEVPATAVPLVVIGLARPGTGVGAPRGPLLDGEVAHHMVGRVLTDNGLTGAVPFGVAVDEEPLTAAVRDCAAALLAAEGLDLAVLVTVAEPVGPTGELVAEASLLRRGPTPTGKE